MEKRNDIVSDVYESVHTLLAIVRSNLVEDSLKKNCKEELYHIKCWLDDEYKKLPIFEDENKWEQTRIINILKDESSTKR